MGWYIEVIKKYGVFEGRARRQEYWMFVLINFAVLLVLSIVVAVIDTLGILSGLYSLAVLPPGLGVTIRRLHDTGRSAWWIFIAFVPIIGFITFIVFMVADNDPLENRYGPNPKVDLSDGSN